jgi:hypothetical protein
MKDIGRRAEQKKMARRVNSSNRKINWRKEISRLVISSKETISHLRI